MTYRLNGAIVTKEEFFAKKGTPIQAGDRITINAQAFEAFASPIDGTTINSAHSLENHNKRNDVVQVGNDLLNKGCEGRTREESINHQKGS